MTMVEAFIRLQKLDEVQVALRDIGVSSLTVTEVRGAGQHNYGGDSWICSTSS